MKVLCGHGSVLPSLVEAIIGIIRGHGLSVWSGHLVIRDLPGPPNGHVFLDIENDFKEMQNVNVNISRPKNERSGSSHFLRIKPGIWTNLCIEAIGSILSGSGPGICFCIFRATVIVNVNIAGQDTFVKNFFYRVSSFYRHESKTRRQSRF